MKIAEMTKGELAERLILSVLNTSDVKERILNFPSIDKGSFSLVVQLFLGEKNYENRYTVRRHIVGGVIRRLFSADFSPRSCGINSDRRLSAA